MSGNATEGAARRFGWVIFVLLIGTVCPAQERVGSFLLPGGQADDGQTSLGYDPLTGEVWVDAPANWELTSINIQSGSAIFTADTPRHLGGTLAIDETFDIDGVYAVDGTLDVDWDDTIFKVMFNGSFGSLSFGNIASSGLSQGFLLSDLTVLGSHKGGGQDGLGPVDLIYERSPFTAPPFARELPAPQSEVRFRPTTYADRLKVDFGRHTVGHDTPVFEFEVANIATGDNASSVDLVEIRHCHRKENSILTTNLELFSGLAPGEARTFQLALDTSAAGWTDDVWCLAFADSDGQRRRQWLTLWTDGRVSRPPPPIDVNPPVATTRPRKVALEASLGQEGDGRTSIVYDPRTGEIRIEAPPGIDLSSVNIQSHSGIFLVRVAEADSRHTVYDASFGGSVGSVSLGNIATPQLSRQFLLDDLSIVESLIGGESLGAFDLIYLPEPSGLGLLAIGIAALLIGPFRARSPRASRGPRPKSSDLNAIRVS